MENIKEQGFKLSSVSETIVKTINAYDKEGTILIFGAEEENLFKVLSTHHIVGIDQKVERIEKLGQDCPNGEFIPWDYSEDLLPMSLDNRKFKFIIFPDTMKEIPQEKKLPLLKKLFEENMEDGGILFIGGTIFQNDEEKVFVEKENNTSYPSYLSYEKLKEDFPHLIYQKVLGDQGILALAKGKRKEKEDSSIEIEPRPSDYLPSHWYDKAEKEIEEENKSKKPQTPVYQEPDAQTLAKWKTVRDIKGTTMFEYGNNFMAAIRPYEKEALSNWSVYGPRLHNLFGGTFRNSDILDFRVTAVTNYFKSEGSVLSKDADYCEWISRLYASVFLRQRFPGDKIGLNLYGLYFGILTDLKMVFMSIGENFTDINVLKGELPSPKGTKLGEILAMGFKQRNY